MTPSADDFHARRSSPRDLQDVPWLASNPAKTSSRCSTPSSRPRKRTSNPLRSTLFRKGRLDNEPAFFAKESTVRIYIESTIPSYLTARPPRDLLQAARQQITRDWWEFRRSAHELFTSQITLDEISAGELEMGRARLEKMAGVPLLDLTPEGERLGNTIIESGILPSNAYTDAAHIAVATVHRIDILLTWNCRHIANGEIEVRLRRHIVSGGYDLPLICTPEELLGEIYE
jgi:hypothetical protein